MAWQTLMWHWLAYAAVSSFLLFAAAGLAILFSDQPVRRLRFIQWALVGAILAPLVNFFAVTPQWHLGLLDARADSATKSNMTVYDVVDSESDMRPGITPMPAGAAEEGILNKRQLGTELHAASAGSSATVSRAENPVPKRRDAETSSASLGETDSGVDLPAIVLLAYSGITGGLMLWWLTGFLRLIRLKVTSRPASRDIVDRFHSIAGDNARANRVRIVVSDHVPMPLTFGWRNPVIVLPEAICRTGRESGLQYCLAHEWAHVLRRDILPWHLSALLQILFFYQPLFWWLRRHLRLCQDYLADAFAAQHATVPEDYAEFLVEQARYCSSRRFVAALGFADSQSSLSRRVVMLLDENHQVESRCRHGWSALVAISAIGLVCATASLRLDASSFETETETPGSAIAAVKPAERSKPKPKAGVKPAKSVTYTGFVTDRVTKKPIAGATVIIDRNLSNPPKGMEDFKKTTRVKSDAKGKYSFTLGPEEVAQSSLYIVVDCHHPNYTAKGRSGYAHSMIQKNLKLGDPPFYSKIRLWPGKAVTGKIVSADGRPVAGVEILSYAKHQKAKRFDFGGFYKTKTDKNGVFRFVAATPGEGVFWITPKGFVPQAHLIPEKRGDIGSVVLQHGVAMKGRVLDAKGKPVGDVRVEARRTGDGEEVDRFLRQNAVANHIGRTATTNAKGEFQLDELPSGDYRVSIRSVKTGWNQTPLKQVFVRKAFKIIDGEKPAPLVIRAVPHVEIHVKFMNSKGKPTRGHRFHVFGRVDRDFYFAQSTRPGKKTGLGIVRVPHGLRETRVNLMTNEHGVLRWRMKPGDALQNSRRIKLGTLEADHHGLEVVRYVAPILLVKAVDSAGKPVKGFKPKAVYAKDSPKTPGSRFINGVRGDVHFEQQSDGRWRSSQLIPDHKLAVIAEREGYTTKPQTVSLKEAAKREIVFVLKKSPTTSTPAKPKK